MTSEDENKFIIWRGVYRQWRGATAEDQHSFYQWMYPDGIRGGIRVVRLVHDTYNPLIIPVELTGNRNAPGVASVPEWLIQEWEAAWERIQVLQGLLRTYERGET